MKKIIVRDSARKSNGTIRHKPVLAGASKLYPAKKNVFFRGLNNKNGWQFPPIGGMRLW